MKGLTPVDNSQLASCLVRAALYLNEWCLGLVRISRSGLASRIQHGLLSGRRNYCSVCTSETQSNEASHFFGQ
jgi:hypothetical protein